MFVADGIDGRALARGPGDFFIHQNGDVHGWVDMDPASICAHQGAVSLNLTLAAVSVLLKLDLLGTELVSRPLPARRDVARSVLVRGSD